MPKPIRLNTEQLAEHENRAIEWFLGLLAKSMEKENRTYTADDVRALVSSRRDLEAFSKSYWKRDAQQKGQARGANLRREAADAFTLRVASRIFKGADLTATIEHHRGHRSFLTAERLYRRKIAMWRRTYDQRAAAPSEQGFKNAILAAVKYQEHVDPERDRLSELVPSEETRGPL